ncbi:serine/threonine-protein kinase [Paracoccus kondratievae]
MTGTPPEEPADSGSNTDRTIMAPLDAPADDVPAADATVCLATAQPPGAARLVKPGTLINNNYRIISLVSVGGMGEVYRAENVFTGDPVAVKVILPNLADDQAVLEMFRHEARVLVQLHDEAIVRYHNFVLDPDLGRYCLIMEFVEGRHLGDRLKGDGALDDVGALTLMRRIGAGLARAHDQGVTHRDLSPDNVILRNDRVDEAVLIDFGIARSTELGDGLAGRFAGKFKYIAPEQLGHWGGGVGPHTDVYGLALLIAAVARGQPLEMGDSVVSASAARQEIPNLDGISHRLFPLLQHMLEPDPARRPADMGTVLRMMDDPSLIASRYRLPLWGGRTPEPVTGGFVTGPDPSGQLHSATPFDMIPAPSSPQPVPEPVQIAPRRNWLLISGGAAVAVMAVAALLLTRPEVTTSRPEPAPLAPDLIPRDPVTREGFLAEQPLPACALAERIGAGPHAGQILLLAPADLDAGPLLAAYGAQFGVTPSLRRVEVAPDQCPVLDFLREVSGRPAPAVLLQAQAASAGGNCRCAVRSMRSKGGTCGCGSCRLRARFTTSPRSLARQKVATGPLALHWRMHVARRPGKTAICWSLCPPTRRLRRWRRPLGCAGNGTVAACAE